MRIPVWSIIHYLIFTTVATQLPKNKKLRGITALADHPILLILTLALIWIKNIISKLLHIFPYVINVEYDRIVFKKLENWIKKFNLRPWNMDLNLHVQRFLTISLMKLELTMVQLTTVILMWTMKKKNYKQKILNMWYSKIQFIFHTKGSHESYENQKNIYKSTKGI